MNEFLEELLLEDLKGETLELAEAIGMEAFRNLVRLYSGTGHLYIPILDNIVVPVRNRHIYEDFKSGGLSISAIALKYKLSDSYIRQIVKSFM